MGINVDGMWLDQAASLLNCKVGKLPFNYLGLPIGTNPRKLVTWNLVVQKVKSRLCSWSSKYKYFHGW